MKKSRFSESQIVAILREAEATEATIAAVCHAHAVSENTFCSWRKRYGSMEVSEVRRLRELKAENGPSRTRVFFRVAVSLDVRNRRGLGIVQQPRRVL